MRPRKVGIVGMGNMGATLALALANESEITELVLVNDNKVDISKQVLSIENTMSYLPKKHHVTIGDFSDLKDAEIILLCLETEMTEIAKNDHVTIAKKIMAIIEPLKNSGFHGVLINLTYPTDVMTLLIQEELNYPSGKIIGLGSLFPSARLRWELSQILGISHHDIAAFCLGAQGFSLMVPWSHVTLAGEDLASFLKKNQIPVLDKRKLLEKIRTSNNLAVLSPEDVLRQIVPPIKELLQTIFYNEQRILPVSVKLTGEYGERNTYCSVPAIIGDSGNSQILTWDLTFEEQIAFAYSCQYVRDEYNELRASLSIDKLKL